MNFILKPDFNQMNNLEVLKYSMQFEKVLTFMYSKHGINNFVSDVFLQIMSDYQNYALKEKLYIFYLIVIDFNRDSNGQSYMARALGQKAPWLRTAFRTIVNFQEEINSGYTGPIGKIEYNGIIYAALCGNRAHELMELRNILKSTLNEVDEVYLKNMLIQQKKYELEKDF